MKFLPCLLVALAITAPVVRAHSWVACAKGDFEGDYSYDDSKCEGYARDFQYYDIGFGGDMGYNYQTDGSQPACKLPLTNGMSWESFYTSQYPSATYIAGQRTCMAWPAKNHVADQCINPYIPDGGVKIYRSAVNPSADVTIDQFRQNLVVDLGANVMGTTEHEGFQNCPNFCDDPENAFCYQCFDFPNLPSGRYTLLWEWVFNPGTPPYTSCMDVEVVSCDGTCPSNCNGRGTCNNCQCECNAGWGGAACDQQVIECTGGCGSHGQCDTTTGTCNCDDRYSGNRCQNFQGIESASTVETASSTCVVVDDVGSSQWQGGMYREWRVRAAAGVQVDTLKMVLSSNIDLSSAQVHKWSMNLDATDGYNFVFVPDFYGNTMTDSSQMNWGFTLNHPDVDSGFLLDWAIFDVESSNCNAQGRFTAVGEGESSGTGPSSAGPGGSLSFGTGLGIGIAAGIAVAAAVGVVAFVIIRRQSSSASGSADYSLYTGEE